MWECLGKNKNASIKVYLFAFFIFMLAVCSVNTPGPIGEWDDYSLPIASIMNDHNFTIDAEDIAVYKKLFPRWSAYIDNYGLSGYVSKSGSGEMPWYFPTYAIICLPMVILLQILDIPTIYAFPYTNLLFLMIALFYIYMNLQVDIKKKAIAVLLMSINPVVFYISWTSAEVFIYAMMVMAAVCWYNRWDKRSAVFISVAGTLNPTIMSVGIVMIVDYVVRIIIQKKENDTWIEYITKCIPDVIGYGACYLIGVIPMVYNYYNIGHINLTASLDGFTHGTETTCSRFIAYIFDLNFGILPYFTVILISASILLIIAVVKRHVRYLEWIITFIINVLLYSIMIHINCGMSGIARYNSWGVVILIFAVVLFYDELVETRSIRNGLYFAMCAGALITGIVIMSYNPFLARNTGYTSMTPIAEWGLDKFPGLYNPLFSTFNSRTNHIDGAYQYENALPIVYTNNNGYVRKILASADNKDTLLKKYKSINGNNEWFIQQVNGLSDNPQYISISDRYNVIRCSRYELGTDIIFASDGYNANDYVACGLCGAEEWGSWTDGKTVIVRFESPSDIDLLTGIIECSTYNSSQDVLIFVNGEQVLNQEGFLGGQLSFVFKNPGIGKIIEIEMRIPSAISLRKLGSSDRRALGLGLQKMIFSETVIPMYTEADGIFFDEANYNADKYVLSGIYSPESWGTWTSGKRTEILFCHALRTERVHLSIDADVFGAEQNIRILVNGQKVFEGQYSGGTIEVDAENNGTIDMVIEMPDAMSPLSIGQSEDERVIALGLKHVSLDEAN